MPFLLSPTFGKRLKTHSEHFDCFVILHCQFEWSSFLAKIIIPKTTSGFSAPCWCCCCRCCCGGGCCGCLFGSSFAARICVLSFFSFQRPRVKSRNKKRNDIETRFMFFPSLWKQKFFIELFWRKFFALNWNKCNSKHQKSWKYFCSYENESQDYWKELILFNWFLPMLHYLKNCTF